MRLYRRRVFPLAEGGLYLTFLTLDLLRLGDSTWVKFAAICLCALTALIAASGQDACMVACAQGLTVGADWFLLVRDDSYPVGVGLFVAVQFLYLLRLAALRSGFSRPGLLLRGAALVLAVGVLARTGDLLSALSLFYFSNLLVNTGEAFFLGEKVFFAGLALFVCCDLCVGLWNLALSPALTEFARVGMWLFYLPSQVLIVLSAHGKGETREISI